MSGVLALMIATGGDSPVLTNRTVVATSDTFAAATLLFETDGRLRAGSGGLGTVVLPEWHGKPAAIVGAGAPWEVRVTVQSGTSPDPEFDVAGVWVPIGTDEFSPPRFALTSVGGTNTGTWLVEIRRASTGHIVASAVYQMSATVI